MKSVSVFSTREKKKLSFIVGFIILALGIWQLYQSWKVREVLISSRVISGEVWEKPECSNSSRRSQFCKVRIDSFNVLAKVEITYSICDSINKGDKLVLKYSNDKKDFYVNDDFFLKSNYNSLVLYSITLIFCLGLILYGKNCFRRD